MVLLPWLDYALAYLHAVLEEVKSLLHTNANTRVHP